MYNHYPFINKEKKMEIDKKEFDAVVKGFSKEEKADFDKLNADEKNELVAEILALEEDTATIGDSVALEDAIHEENDCRIHIAGGALIKVGRVITAQYLGLQYTFSRAKKENWEEVLAMDGKTKMYRSKFHRFRRTDGVEFGVFATPMMNNALRTVLTASSGAAVEGDPTVRLAYDGKVSKEVAGEKYGFKMDTGKETHAWNIQIEKSAKRGQGRGVLNPLNPPLPMGASDDQTLSSDEVTLRNFKELHGGNTGVAKLENNTAALQ
jgi:hypothetical protein